MKRHKLESMLVGAVELALGVTIGRRWEPLTQNYALVLVALLGVAAVIVWYWSHLLRDDQRASAFGLRYLCTAVFVLNIAIFRLLSR